MLEVTYRSLKGISEDGQLYEYYTACTKVMDFVEYAQLLINGEGHILHIAWVEDGQSADAESSSKIGPASPSELDMYAERWADVLQALEDIIYQIPGSELQKFFGFPPLSVRLLKSTGTVRVDFRRLVLFLCEMGIIQRSLSLGVERTS